ncbi:MAG: hypothetical protein AAFN30_21125, partial [Actinomycetota bacterium]
PASRLLVNVSGQDDDEPASEYQSYDEVPWYRKQWFIVVTFLIFIPALLIIVLSGDVYQKSRGRLAAASPDTEVWKYTSRGKTMLVVAAAVWFVAAIGRSLVAG